ncbi:adenylate/guanylate cyclase domain-containing protein [Planktothrix paucivesiculata]|uniref:Adenylate/guanylate cyclase with GAF sensor and FHA domain n=1 Tax=Planktothrix paucivesiculata PCC 9631 TaxID=671071 RepID=A0A7Z9BJU5_9CYAN|nr:Adenylate/guanylate cyclase with GAF sensor and FHA domain [Planktothrix paucivesiculata PCC 9631]
MPYLICNPDTTSAMTFNLQFGVNTIGRGRDSTICLADVSLSRHHARIDVSEGKNTITDMQSSNHTFVNEVMIEHTNLKSGDLIRCGRVVFKFMNVSLTPALKADAENHQTSVIQEFATDNSYTIIQDLLGTSQARNSVLNIRQQDANLRIVDKLKILLEVSKELSSPNELNKLLDRILDLLFQIMNLDRAAILLVNPQTNNLENKAVKFREEPLADEHFYSKKITNIVRETGNAVLIDNAQADERFEGSESILCQAIHASMCAPLKLRDSVIGVLYVDNLSLSNLYSPEDVEFLAALANQAAIAIENAELYKKMQEEAVIRNKLERFFPPAVSRKLREEGKFDAIVESEVTALFSDITRFTEMSSRMQPRQVISMLNEYFKLMVEEIVFPFEGTLEKYIGDALVAVWGAPYSRHDDVDRAVRAAIEMQWTVDRMNQQWKQRYGEPIYIHIGLNTGQVAAGNIGSEKLIQYTHIGDTMNVASRICSAANRNEILISQSTLDQLKDRSLPLEKIPPVIVKGKTEPLQLYRLHWQEVQSTALSF